MHATKRCGGRSAKMPRIRVADGSDEDGEDVQAMLSLEEGTDAAQYASRHKRKQSHQRSRRGKSRRHRKPKAADIFDLRCAMAFSAATASLALWSMRRELVRVGASATVALGFASPPVSPPAPPSPPPPSLPSPPLLSPSPGSSARMRLRVRAEALAFVSTLVECARPAYRTTQGSRGIWSRSRPSPSRPRARGCQARKKRA